MSKPTASVRRGRLLRATAAGAALLALAGYLVVHLSTGGSTPPHCTVRGVGEDAATYRMQPEQAGNAATIQAVGSSRGLPERAVTIAIATAMQESGLRNIGYGDRDSVGLFQQRPSQGWGTGDEIMDPVYSVGKFYDQLVEVQGYAQLPLTVAAQRVQHSGFPRAYAKHEPNASLLAAALTGRAAATFSCTTDGDEAKPGDPARVRSELARAFGADVLPRAGSEGRVSGHSEGVGGKQRNPAVAVPVRAKTADGSVQRGWELAHWSVAQASDLRIARVSYAGRVWKASDSAGEWHRADSEAEGSGPSPTDEVLITVVQ